MSCRDVIHNAAYKKREHNLRVVVSRVVQIMTNTRCYKYPDVFFRYVLI